MVKSHGNRDDDEVPRSTGTDDDSLYIKVQDLYQSALPPARPMLGQFLSSRPSLETFAE